MDLVQGEDEEFVSVLLGISGHVSGGAPGGVEEGGRTVGDGAVGVYLRSLSFRCPQQYKMTCVLRRIVDPSHNTYSPSTCRASRYVCR